MPQNEQLWLLVAQDVMFLWVDAREWPRAGLNCSAQEPRFTAAMTANPGTRIHGFVGSHVASLHFSFKLIVLLLAAFLLHFMLIFLGSRVLQELLLESVLLGVYASVFQPSTRSICTI